MTTTIISKLLHKGLLAHINASPKSKLLPHIAPSHRDHNHIVDDFSLECLKLNALDSGRGSTKSIQRHNNPLLLSNRLAKRLCYHVDLKKPEDSNERRMSENKGIVEFFSKRNITRSSQAYIAPKSITSYSTILTPANEIEHKLWEEPVAQNHSLLKEMNEITKVQVKVNQDKKTTEVYTKLSNIYPQKVRLEAKLLKRPEDHQQKKNFPKLYKRENRPDFEARVKNIPSLDLDDFSIEHKSNVSPAQIVTSECYLSKRSFQRSGMKVKVRRWSVCSSSKMIPTKSSIEENEAGQRGNTSIQRAFPLGKSNKRVQKIEGRGCRSTIISSSMTTIDTSKKSGNGQNKQDLLGLLMRYKKMLENPNVGNKKEITEKTRQILEKMKKCVGKKI